MFGTLTPPLHCTALSPLVWYATPSGEAGGEATALALKDAVEALRQHRAEPEQIELVLRARVISDAALEVVTKALGEEVITAGAVDAEGMDEEAKTKAQTELATAKEHVKLHEKQKTAIAAARAANGRDSESCCNQPRARTTSAACLPHPPSLTHALTHFRACGGRRVQWQQCSLKSQTP